MTLRDEDQFPSPGPASEDGDRPQCPLRERPIADIIGARLSRRTALKGLLATAGVGVVGETLVSRVALAAAQGAAGDATAGASSLGFAEVGQVYDENMHVAPG